jgi:hypothetical protein
LGDAIDTQTRKTGPRGDVLEERRMLTGQNRPTDELVTRLDEARPDDLASDMAIAERTVRPEQRTETTTSVFERMFPGRSDLQNVSLDEILNANVRLNDISRNTKSDFTRRSLTDAKKALAQREAELTAGTEFTDVATRRELYGALKDAEKIFSTENTSQLFSLVDDIVSAQKQGRGQDYKKAFENIRSVSPEYANRLETILIEKGSTWKNLIARQGANPAEKIATLADEGIEIPRGVGSAGRIIEEIGALQKTAGKIDPKTGQASPEAFKFASNLGELQGRKLSDPRIASELDDALNIIKDYDPDMAQRLRTQGANDADILRMVKILQGTGEIGFVPTTMTGALIKVLQVLGLPKMVAFGGRQAGRIERGGQYIKNSFNTIKQSLDQDIGALGPRFGKFDDALRKANERGDSALRATIYVLSQQHPEFRDMVQELDK